MNYAKIAQSTLNAPVNTADADKVYLVDGTIVLTSENNLLATAYRAEIARENRAAEYPAIGDQLDALWKGGEAAADMLAKVQAVKAKYPKE
jgi:hypothetical protein